MALTYRPLVNTLLNALNEVEIVEADFLTTRGITSRAKSSVRLAVNDVHNAEFEWPFNQASTTQTLAAGTETYAFPADFASADWQSFRLTKDGTYLQGGKRLTYLDKNRYYDNYQVLDDDSGAAGRGVPAQVFRAHADRYGLTPSPDKPYVLAFDYWKTPPTLTAHGDDTRIPDRFESVVLARAEYYFHMFKEDVEKSQIKEAEYRTGLALMRSQLLDVKDVMADARVAF